MRQLTPKRLTAWLLTLVMALSLLPTTALAAYPDASNVFVDGKKQFYDGRLYYRKGDESKHFTGNENDYIAHYDPTTGKLTLNGYSGGSISVGGVKCSDITVVLKGTNTINGSLANDVGGDITITGNGTLSITNTLSGSNPAIGIETGLSASYKTGNVTIEGSAKVTIDTTHGGTGDKEKAYGIFAKENITISGDASVDITCATPYSTYRLGDYCNGLRADKKVTINTNGTIKIDVKTAGKVEDNGDSYGYSYGVYPMNGATLTKVGNMVVQWKKNGSSGGAIYRGGNFDTTPHAVNVDTTNCYASYRFGTPYQVTVGNGQLTGPGVMYPTGSGMFLKGDKVSITPNVKTGKSGEVIPFQKWTSDDVTFDKSATTADNSFTVPSKKVTVIAEHSPFDGKPTFTPTGDLNNRGVLTFKTVVKPYDGNEYFALVKVGEEDNYNNGINPNTSSQTKPYVYTYEASSGHSSYYVEPGEYYVAEKLNNWWYLSEKFTVNYTASAADISVRGTIKSYNPNNTTTIQLMQGGKEQYKTTIDPASGSGQKKQNFSFPAVAKGIYDLVVTKPGHLTYTVKNVEVGDTDLDLTKLTGKPYSTITLLCGDINGDGWINSTDLGVVLQGQNYGKQTTVAGVNGKADLNGDGWVNSTDLGIVLQGQHYGKSAVSVNFGE